MSDVEKCRMLLEMLNVDTSVRTIQRTAPACFRGENTLQKAIEMVHGVSGGTQTVFVDPEYRRLQKELYDYDERDAGEPPEQTVQRMHMASSEGDEAFLHHQDVHK